MILYCDTSALIKRYVMESGTDIVDAAWNEASVVSTSVVAYAEGLAAFHRRHREGYLSQKELKTVSDRFRNDFSRIVLVPVDRHLHPAINDLLRKYSLRGFDVIHLASVLIFSDDSEDIQFACFDGNLSKAAAKEGIRTLAA